MVMILYIRPRIFRTVTATSWPASALRGTQNPQRSRQSFASRSITWTVEGINPIAKQGMHQHSIMNQIRGENTDHKIITLPTRNFGSLLDNFPMTSADFPAYVSSMIPHRVLHCGDCSQAICSFGNGRHYEFYQKTKLRASMSGSPTRASQDEGHHLYIRTWELQYLRGSWSLKWDHWEVKFLFW